MPLTQWLSVPSSQSPLTPFLLPLHAYKYRFLIVQCYILPLLQLYETSLLSPSVSHSSLPFLSHATPLLYIYLSTHLSVSHPQRERGLKWRLAGLLLQDVIKNPVAAATAPFITMETDLHVVVVHSPSAREGRGKANQWEAREQMAEGRH